VWAGAFTEEKYKTIPGGALSLTYTPVNI
jgi:hypothetical protein